ncbi:MAG: hypothetical protein FJ034_02730 [Chloroflexi bacterium]|nr:hypothetical protein [Chloroflexota bacterium]
MVERTRIARAFAPHPALLMALAACVVGFLVIGLGAALGPLPPGAAALAWVYLVAATVTAVAVTSWMAILADPFSRALLVTYTAAAVTTVLTLAAWLPLFFWGGRFDGGGPERFLAGLLLHLLAQLAGGVASLRFWFRRVA